MVFYSRPTHSAFSSMETVTLIHTAAGVRRNIVEMIYRAKSSHIGCSLSVADILVALYFSVMRVDSRAPALPARDRLVLSKGHSVSALYATLAERGFFSKERILEYGTEGTTLASHAVHGSLPGMETSAGSGGHGQSLGVGMALAAMNDKTGSRIFVVSGDGEMQEGSAWEAIMFAGFHKLSNFTLVIDRNRFQDGSDGLGTEDILNADSFEDKLRAFHFDVERVNGHRFEELIPALHAKTARPRAIIADTVKGKGVSFMEGRPEWHGKCPSAEEYATAMRELSV
ncbi:MAG: Transketolase subunit A [Parcubacteria group bacterium GW2011_GWA2_47_12]|nr:MAG: Transketolase subunit A [Parcubacteria group bacterium GW2011_GWA2_47_12]